MLFSGLAHTSLVLLTVYLLGLGDITGVCDNIGLKGGSGAWEVGKRSISWMGNTTLVGGRGLVWGEGRVRTRRR